MTDLPSVIPSPDSSVPAESRATIEHAALLVGPLRPWMKHLAEWHATQPDKISLKMVRDMAVQLAGYPVALYEVRALVSREDWLAYREEIALDIVLQARRKFEGRFVQYVDKHYEALAMAEKAEDHRAMAQITEPVLDRVYPKRDQHAAQSQTVILNLAPGMSPAQVLEHEFLPVEIVPVDSSES